MPFKLNEAPDTIISIIYRDKLKRDCCKFWSIFCCIPTLGISICCGSNYNCINCDENENWMGCYPKQRSTEEYSNIKALKDTIKDYKK